MEALLRINRITEQDMRALHLFCSVFELASMELDDESRISENLFKKQLFEKVSTFLSLNEIDNLRKSLQKFGYVTKKPDFSLIDVDIPESFCLEINETDLNYRNYVG